MADIDKIFELAKERGVKKSYICEKLGLKRSYLNDVKNKKTRISDSRLKIIANILNTTPEYLKGEGDRENEVEKLGDENKQDLLKSADNDYSTLSKYLQKKLNRPPAEDDLTYVDSIIDIVIGKIKNKDFHNER